MSLSQEQTAAIYDFCDLIQIAKMFAVPDSEASNWAMSHMETVINTVFKAKKTRPYNPNDPRSGPRLDWSKATPRLPEKEWLVLRGRIFRRDGYICSYCGDVEATMRVDHVTLLSRGGTNEADNLVVACMPCNSSKGFKLLTEWRGRYQ